MTTPEKIQAALDRISDDIKSHAEKAEREIKAHAKLSEDTRASVDKLLTEQGELKARLLAAEQSLASRGSDRDERVMSIGQQVVASEEFAAFAARPRGTFSMPVRAALTSGESSGGDLIVPDRVPGIVAPGLRRLTVRDLISWGRTASNSVEFVRESDSDLNADVVSENPADGKPESDLLFEADSAPVVTIAHWIHASRQVLADVPMLQSYIDGRMRYGLKLVEEAQLLNGSGTGLNIDGIATQASAYSDPGVNPTGLNRIDILRLALLQVELANYAADAIIVNPTDWAAIELLKTASELGYLFSNPHMMTRPMLWGRNVVSTTAVDGGDFVVGAFGGGMAVQGWDREDMNVFVSLEDRDNVIKNMVTIRVEERLALTVYRPSAFVAGSFVG